MKYSEKMTAEQSLQFHQELANLDRSYAESERFDRMSRADWLWERMHSECRNLHLDLDWRS